jgi:hypothetical protein
MKPLWVCYPAYTIEGVWWVQDQNDRSGNQVCFYGPQAEQNAKEYAEWKSGQVRMRKWRARGRGG